MSVATMVEHEVKLGVPPRFCLPALDGVLEGMKVVPIGALSLDAVYYDTPELRLARSGVTLRHRSAEGWTLKLPSGEGSGEMLSRRELNVAGEEATVPAELEHLVVAWMRLAPLGPVARLQTVRHRLELVDDQGRLAAEVVDDEVSVLDGPSSGSRFREVEVELRPAAPAGLIEAVVSRLQAAGAGPGDPTPKVMRALGPRAVEPPELAVVAAGSEGSAAAAIAAGLAASLRRLVDHDVGVRLGDDAEDVHQARVATRRLRSDLRTYAPLLDKSWAEELRAELKWVAAALGEVRDVDVLLVRLEEAAAGLVAMDRPAMAGIVARLRSRRVEARNRLAEVLDDRRYAALLDRLVGALSPPLLDAVPAVPAGAPSTVVAPERWLRSGAEAPACDVLPALVRRPWKRLREAVAAAKADGSDEALHEVRKRAKQCRYAAEVAAVAVGKPARRLASAVEDLQEVLGDHQDAAVAEEWLRSVVPELTAAEAFVAGQLVAGQRALADATRRKWPKAWERADRSKLRAWMS